MSTQHILFAVKLLPVGENNLEIFHVSSRSFLNFVFQGKLVLLREIFLHVLYIQGELNFYGN